MKDGLNFGEINLWEGTPSEAIWHAFRNHLDARVSAVFGSDRSRSIIAVRSSMITSQGASLK